MKEPACIHFTSPGLQTAVRWALARFVSDLPKQKQHFVSLRKVGVIVVVVVVGIVAPDELLITALLCFMLLVLSGQTPRGGGGRTNIFASNSGGM